MNVLVLNCSSSSTKFAVVHASNGHAHVSGAIRGLGTADAALDFAHERRAALRAMPGETLEGSLRTVFDLLAELGLSDRLLAVGHRVAHGGARFSGSIFITPGVVAK